MTSLLRGRAVTTAVAKQTGRMLCTIVGAGPGLGAALARRFLAGGCDVALVSRSPDRLKRWRQRQPKPKRIGLFAADAGSPEGLEEAFEAIRRWQGETSVLIYNAADMAPDQVSSLDSVRLLDAMRIDVGGALTCVQEVLPAMRHEGRGTILLTGGGLALEPYPEWGSLAAGKAALRSVGLNLFKELLPAGIHVAVVAVCGIVEPGGPFDPDLVAEQYWRLHEQPLDQAQRELVYLPQGADPYYNDPKGRYRDTSEPIRALDDDA